MGKFIAINNQAFSIAYSIKFRNVLLAMHPVAKCANLPSAHDVKVYLNNWFVDLLDNLRQSIEHPIKGQQVIGSMSTMLWENGPFDQRSLGLNLGQYLVGALDCIGIMGPKLSKLHTITLDNTSTNNTTCEAVESIHNCRLLPSWDAVKNQLPCFEHVGNLAIVDIMSHIMKVAAIETSTAIWEFDPTLKDNCLLGGLLDVIAAIQTFAIKQIKYFNNLQIECNITTPLCIPLHSNTRWGTAFGMLEQAFKLRKAIALFLNSADELYGPITTIRKNNQISKKIPWSAFLLKDSNWDLIHRAIKVLADTQALLHHFLSETQPRLWKVLPALEDLQTSWEEKAANLKYSRFHAALADGLAKIGKYYSKLNEKPVFVMAIVLHPYFKLNYIKLQWGGPEEQAIEHANGNANARDWQDEA